MITKFIALGATALAGCLPAACQPANQGPAAKPACEGMVIVLNYADEPVNCDLTPPQVLSYWMDDPGPIQEQDCRNRGGAIVTWENDVRCEGIDY